MLLRWGRKCHDAFGVGEVVVFVFMCFVECDFVFVVGVVVDGLQEVEQLLVLLWVGLLKCVLCNMELSNCN